MNDSLMVYAKKYRLTQAISQKAGTYKNTGKEHEREFITSKIVSRAHVEERNAGKHHEFWIIDNARTEELFGEGGIQQKNIEKQARDKANATATMGDLIQAMGSKPQPVIADNSELEALKAKLAKTEKELKESRKVVVTHKAIEPITPKEPISYPNDTPSKEWTVKQLQAYCNDNGIKYHHLTKEAGLLELINETK